MSDRLAVLPQYLLPKQALTTLAGKFASAQLGGLTTSVIRRFVARYNVNMAEAANPDITDLGAPPDILLAIPVIEVELNGDGSIRRTEVLRRPRQATDTIDIALAALRRAAPFGDVSRLPRPWKFTETFLFDDARHFKPRTLD